MRRITRGIVPGLAALAVVASGGWLATGASEYGSGYGGRMHGSSTWDHGMMGGGMMNGAGAMSGGMMNGGSGYGWSSEGGAPARNLQQARDRAEDFAAELGSSLSVGEVMDFSENYYAELEETDGDLATEVLIDPDTGAVRLEYGPAMMWNQGYGMMRTARAQGSVTAEEAHDLAAEWAQGRGLKVGEADAFPGYYTLHTLRDGQVDGMVSVNATSGQIWYHDWHGQFVDMSEPH